MSNKKILKMHIFPIKTELIQISNDIKYYLNNSEYSDYKNF